MLPLSCAFLQENLTAPSDEVCRFRALYCICTTSGLRPRIGRESRLEECRDHCRTNQSIPESNLKFRGGERLEGSIPWPSLELIYRIADKVSLIRPGNFFKPRRNEAALRLRNGRLFLSVFPSSQSSPPLFRRRSCDLQSSVTRSSNQYPQNRVWRA